MTNADVGATPPVQISLDAVVVSVTEETPRILTVSGSPAGEAGEVGARYELPSGPLNRADRTLELGLRRVLLDQTGVEVGYAEQLYSFGDLERSGVDQPRLLSLAYLTLVHETGPPGGVRSAELAQWSDVYDFLPWEDHRSGRPAILDELEPAVMAWVGEESGARRERAEVVFGLNGSPWDGVRVLERYELLYEVGLVGETGTAGREAGMAMVLDHRRIVATALGRLRGKLTYRPVVFELLPDVFTLLHLQRLVEALAGVQLHKQNFRRLVENGGLVEGTGEYASTGGRPAELFRFRRDVVRERPRPGVGTPWVRS